MFNLTPQERQVILFLISISLICLGINFAVKINSKIENIIKTDINTTKLDINKVGLEELVAGQYLTPKLAKNIVEYRNIHGPFRDLEELKEIRGIGDYRYEKLKGLFFVEWNIFWYY